MSPTAERFIRDSIRSVWELELLLLMRRTPERSWDAGMLERELRSSRMLTAAALLSLTRAGLVAEDPPGHYRYRPASPQLDLVADELEQAYAQTPAAVMQAIWSAPNSKIQTFADAFRLKKD